ncbi:hypothetical protein ACIRO3_29770 [Streptomyces sp. NPDC102278]|uniref:hypothetical protein n=1 Tax=Streptomyces sp. NPDC102278 TaxID=3366152 RepID=UPI00382E75C8
MTLLPVAQAKELDNLFHARMDEQLAPGYVRSGEGADLIDLIRLPRPDIPMRPVDLWREDALVAAFALQDGTPQDGTPQDGTPQDGTLAL